MRPTAIIFTRQQAPGAWPNGTIVRKVNSQPTDTTPNGTTGKIMGSIDVADQGKAARFAYFVEWAHRPGIPVFVTDTNNEGTPRLELDG